MNTTTKIIGGIALAGAAAFAAFKLFGKKEAPAPPPPAPVPPPPPPAPPKAHKPKPQAKPKESAFMTRAQSIGLILWGLSTLQLPKGRKTAVYLGGNFTVCFNRLSDSQLETYAKHSIALMDNIKAGNVFKVSAVFSAEAKKSIEELVRFIDAAVQPEGKAEDVVNMHDLQIAVKLNSAMDGAGTKEDLLFASLRAMKSFKSVKAAYESIYSKNLMDTIKSELSDEGFQLAMELRNKKP